MPYDIPKLSDHALRQIWLTIDDIAHRAEVRQQTQDFEFGLDYGLKGVNWADHKGILWQLSAENFISIRFSFGFITLDIHETFQDFYNQVYEEYMRRRQAKKSAEPKPEFPHYDELNGTLYVRGFKVKIRRQNKDTYENQILKHILITHKGNIGQEFDYNNIPFDYDGLVEQKQKAWSRCRTACLAINKKIAGVSDHKITDFLQFNSRKHGWLNINPKYLK